MQLARFPRTVLAHLPTPLERMERLTKALGGPEIWIKRDDCTGLSTGGNKTRKLEFLIGEARALGADMVMTVGATQSNHARQTAASAAKCGLKCRILLEDIAINNTPAYNEGGNILLDDLHGATREFRPVGGDINADMETAAEDFRARGHKVYTIPVGGSNPTGALGYVNCAQELLGQANDRQLVIDHLVHASGSAGTQAGLIAGIRAMNADIALLGISVSKPFKELEENVFRLACDVADMIGASGIVGRGDVVANSDYVGEGYGIPATDTVEAIRMFARLEGILLDPVYSGKAAAGLIDLVRKGRFKKGQRVVFLHTGGSVGLFAYPSVFKEQ